MIPRRRFKDATVEEYLLYTKKEIEIYKILNEEDLKLLKKMGIHLKDKMYSRADLADILGKIFDKVDYNEQLDTIIPNKFTKKQRISEEQFMILLDELISLFCKYLQW